MDLYESGDYAGRVHRHLVPAGGDADDDEHHGRGERHDPGDPGASLFNLARSLDPAPDGAVEPEGWAKGLTQLGYGNYEVDTQPTIRAAVKIGRGPDAPDQPARRHDDLARRALLGHVRLHVDRRPGRQRQVQGRPGSTSRTSGIRGSRRSGVTREPTRHALRRSPTCRSTSCPGSARSARIRGRTGNFVTVIPIE